MIHRAKFQNFKALRDVEVTFDSRLTVLVGPTGSGKTSVLQGIQFLGLHFRTMSLPGAIEKRTARGMTAGWGWSWSDDEQYSFDQGAIGNSVVEVQGKYAGNLGVYCCVNGNAVYEPRGDGVPDRERLGSGLWRFENGEYIATGTPLLLHLRSAQLLRLDPARLATPSLPMKIPPEISTDGSGLPSVLLYLLRKYPEQFRSVTEALHAVVRSVEGIRLDLEPLGAQFSDTILFDFVGAKGVRAISASDGTLFVLGLLAVVFGPDSPRLLLLDDFDHGLHPKAQMELIGVLRKLLAQFPDLQIIATSHSPYILDKLAWNEVRVTALNDDGSAVCKPLTDHPKYPMWKDSMSPGEFWSHGGEDWVKQLTPQTAAP